MKRTTRRTKVIDQPSKVKPGSGQQPSSPRRRPSGSWVDRLTAAIDRAPSPLWATYLVLFALVLGVVTGLAWMGGGTEAMAFLPIYFLTAAWAVFPLALIHHLDRVSARALAQFRPVCDIEDTEADRLRAELTTMPGLPTALVGLAGVGFIWFFYLSNRRLFAPILASEAQFIVAMIVLTFSFAMLGVLLYHSVRQLRLVSRIYARVKRLDLFNLSPLYGFAALAARTSIAWAAALYLSLALNPAILGSYVALGASLVQAGLVLGTFTWPLVGVHRRIGEKKDQALAEVGESLNQAIAELNARTRSMSLSRMDALNKMILSLVAAREVLSKVPTWPWSPGTPVAVGSALLLPVGLYLLQRLIERVIGL